MDAKNLKLLELLFKEGSITINNNGDMLEFLEFLNKETIKENNKKRRV